MNKAVSIIVALAIVTVSAVLWRAYVPKPAAVSWQGWVEGNFLFLAPDEAGRVVTLRVREGDWVQKGSPLFAVQNELQDAEMRQATAALSEAKARLERAEAAQQRPEEIAVLEAQKARAEAALEQSQPELQRAKELVSRGVSPKSRLDSASSTYARDQAALSEIKRQIDVARLESRSEDIAAARAVVAQAESRLAAANVSLDRRLVAAPADSRVQEIFYREGEVVPAARPVLSLLPPGNLRLRFFVPQAELALLHPGTRVNATCDGCPSPIAATISFISTEAEFTPPVIFSREERQKLVFRIEARPDAGADLRVGLPITVTLAEKDGSRDASGQ